MRDEAKGDLGRTMYDTREAVPGRPKLGWSRECGGVLLAFIGDSIAIIVAGWGCAGIAEDTGWRGMAGPKESVTLPELGTRLLGEYRVSILWQWAALGTKVSIHT